MSVPCKKWLVTGAAGFIGSHIVESLIELGSTVKGFDDLESGQLSNLDEVRTIAGEKAWSRFTLIKGDIRNMEDCRKACEDVDIIVHLAAVSSIPNSIMQPHVTTEVNVSGFVNMLTAAKDAGVKRFVYASSCSVYGNEPTLPKREDSSLFPLSPYALSKQVNELYADMYGLYYGLETVGLRYFNVYGSRQKSLGACAGVIPIWFNALSQGDAIFINGDGKTTRDFCHVKDVTQANILAGILETKEALNRVYNIAYGKQTSLNDLVKKIASVIRQIHPDMEINPKVVYRDFREGDIKHSWSDISRARKFLNFHPAIDLDDGLLKIAEHYLSGCLS